MMKLGGVAKTPLLLREFCVFSLRAQKTLLNKGVKKLKYLRLGVGKINVQACNKQFWRKLKLFNIKDPFCTNGLNVYARYEIRTMEAVSHFHGILIHECKKRLQSSASECLACMKECVLDEMRRDAFQYRSVSNFASASATQGNADVPAPASFKGERPEKFLDTNFKRWQQKMFYLTTLNLSRFLIKDHPSGGDAIDTQSNTTAEVREDI
ncbi:hypothetical protein RND71_029527 [Anisodus tanguticus]|uniref:Uncharacterized protein n=1 Tax=Anisodus tanguticus TaxID=243964 RepID=A0AAE1V6D7_9SOLA|nr:hypothetical protein RND71_029527 [Anisodus tanguticus]